MVWGGSNCLQVREDAGQPRVINVYCGYVFPISSPEKQLSPIIPRSAKFQLCGILFRKGTKAFPLMQTFCIQQIMTKESSVFKPRHSSPIYCSTTTLSCLHSSIFKDIPALFFLLHAFYKQEFTRFNHRNRQMPTHIKAPEYLA